MFLVYFLGGCVGLSILALPAEWTAARVVVYMLAQAVITGSFVLADEIVAEVVSTDVRSISFVVVDGVSKVRFHL